MKRTSIILLVFACIKFILQLTALLQPEFGIFRDEFYYLACTKHLAWGFVDHPPFSIAVLWVWTSIAGDSIVSLRILAALFGTIPVIMTGLITRQLGGEWKAQMLACFAVVCAPIQIGISSFYSMNVLEYALIPMLVWLLIKIIQEKRPSLWILFGVFLGIGIMNKHTFAVLAVFLLAGMMLTPARKEITSKYFWLGIAAAVLVVLPNFLWQVSNNFISLEFYKNASEMKNVPTSPVKIILDQLFSSNPMTAILWLSGLAWFFAGKGRTTYRMLGVAFLLLLGMMIAAQSNRADRIALFIPVLIAGGAVLWEQINGKRFMRWLIPVTVVSIALVCAATLPVALPVLPPSKAAAYIQKLGIGQNFEKGVTAALPQNMADRFGWTELADTIHAVVQRMPEEDRSSVVLLASNYGEAGAVEYYQRSWQWPRVISGHNSYWVWGPGEPAKVYIIIGYPKSRLEGAFEDIQIGSHTSSGWQMNYECNRTIWVCRGAKIQLSSVWNEVKHFI